MSVAQASPQTTQPELYLVRYRNCGHGRTTTLEEYYDLAVTVSSKCHQELKSSDGVTWKLTLPNADCNDCSPAEKEYWEANVGSPPKFTSYWDPIYRSRAQAHQQRSTLVGEMLAEAAKILGRDRVSLGDLFALIGQTALVRAADYGCDGNRMVWAEEATITALCRPQYTSVDDPEYGTFSHDTPEPVFELRGTGRTVITCLLSNMKFPASASS